MSTFDELCKILVRDYAVAAESLTPDTTLESLAIDSLGVIELVFEIEDIFKVSVPDGDGDRARSFGTLAELTCYIDQLIAVSNGARAAKPAAERVGISTSS